MGRCLCVCTHVRGVGKSLFHDSLRTGEINTTWGEPE